MIRKALLFFGILDDMDVEWLVSAGHSLDVGPGGAVIREGEPAGDLYLVIDGTLSVTVGRANREIARAGSGELIGEISFVDSRPPSASVTAVVRTRLLAIPRRQLAARLEEDLTFAAHFYKATSVFLADRLRTTVGHLGYGDDSPGGKHIEDRDGLDEDLMEEVSMAAARFDRLQRRMRAESGALQASAGSMP